MSPLPERSSKGASRSVTYPIVLSVQVHVLVLLLSKRWFFVDHVSATTVGFIEKDERVFAPVLLGIALPQLRLFRFHRRYESAEPGAQTRTGDDVGRGRLTLTDTRKKAELATGLARGPHITV